uniref:Uncharacterized protein n=1 Tax=Neobodo designis TaxID=312471 RepID=A0A7S1MR16_NEODS
MKKNVASTASEVPYAQLVAQWASSAHSVNANDRADILEREIEAAGSGRASLARKLALQRDTLRALSQSEDRCFESLARQISFNNGVIAEHLLEPDASLHVAVRNCFAKFDGARNVHDELARHGDVLGEPVEETSMWPRSDNTYVFFRQHAVGVEFANTKVVDTITFHRERFTVATIERCILPSHSTCSSQHVAVTGIDYLSSAS